MKHESGNPGPLEDWERRFAEFLDTRSCTDAAHDRGHVRRVVANAKRIATTERADLDIVVPAAWLHDCVQAPKDSPRRGTSSLLAAREAGGYLRETGYPPGLIPAIEHAIEAHSFTAGILARTIEARVVQDADRLDALGAIGIARCLMLAGESGRPLHHPEEPVPTSRAQDDRAWALDHFFVKLLRLEQTMTTETGRREAAERTAIVREFVERLVEELKDGLPGV